MRLQNILKSMAPSKPKLRGYSCGGTLNHYKIFEQVQSRGIVEPSFAVLEKGKATAHLKELEHNNIIYRPYKKIPWQPPSERLSYDSELALYNEIRQFIYDHVDLGLGEEYGYDVMTSFVMASWQLEKWFTVPYLFFYGPHESGKTRALEVLSKLCSRGWLALYITPANLYRPLEQWKPTLFLDEAETYGDMREIIALLNASYRRGQLVPRQVETKEGYETVFYDCFGFKALAGTRRLAQTLQSRCIMFKMSKATRKINLFINEEQALNLRNKLLGYRFIKIGEHNELGEHFWKRGMELAEQIGSSRLTELFFPLWTVAPTTELKDKLVKCALEISQVRTEELSASDEATCLSAILEAYDKQLVERGLILIKDVCYCVNQNLAYNEQWTNRHVGSVCSRIGFLKLRTKRGYSIRWDNRLIERLKKDQRYKSCFEEPPPAPSGNSSPSSPSSPETEKFHDVFPQGKA